MTVGKAITNYIAHQRCLGKQFSAASAILTAFCRSIGDIPLREVLPETVAHFVDSKGTSDETIRKKLGALANFFRFAVALMVAIVSNAATCENSEVPPSRPTFTPIQR